MNMQTMERINQQLPFALDSMPQLICLVDGDGRVIRANRAVERWKLGAVEAVRGRYLHDVLHAGCSDPACYLRLFWQRPAASAGDRRAECDAWDPILKRHFVIRTTIPVRAPEQEASSEDFFVVTVDDVTELKGIEGESGQPAQILTKRTEHEVEKRTQAQRVQARLLTILDKTPNLVAMADQSGTLFYLNPAGRALLELGSRDEISGMTLRGFHAAGIRDTLDKEAIPHAERNGVWTGDSILLTRDGREIKTFLTFIAHHDRGGEAEGFSMNLRPSILDDLGILPALAWFFREFEATGVKTKIEREIGISEADVPPPLRIAIFRMLQEATENAVKHADAERIKVSLCNMSDTIEFSIEDNGKGFDSAGVGNNGSFNKGLGLQSMRERAELSGGTYDMESAPGKGTRIRVRWPFAKALKREMALLR